MKPFQGQDLTDRGETSLTQAAAKYWRKIQREAFAQGAEWSSDRQDPTGFTDAGDPEVLAEALRRYPEET